MCMSCFDTSPYFDMQNGLCISCPYPTTYSNFRKGCFNISYLTNLSAPRLMEVDNYTIANVAAQQNNLRKDASKIF